LEETGTVLEKELKGAKEYYRVRSQLKDQLVGQQCTLNEAVTKLARTEIGALPRWHKILQLQYPGFSREQCLGANLVEFSMASLDNQPSGAQDARRLEADYLATFGTRLPRQWGCRLARSGNPQPSFSQD